VTARKSLDVPSGNDSVDRKVPPPEIVVDIDVNTVVSALDKEAANPIPTTATRPTTAAACHTVTTTS
jgi:hypothetical protein